MAVKIRETESTSAGTESSAPKKESLISKLIGSFLNNLERQGDIAAASGPNSTYSSRREVSERIEKGQRSF